MTESEKNPDERNPRDAQGYKENPAEQGLKTPPKIPAGEESGEWTRGGGTDTNEGQAEAEKKS